MNLKFYITLLALFFSVINFVSCKTVPISDLTQEDGIARIKKNYEAKEWTEVINNVDEYKTRYPYSQYTQDADLMQGDAYYQSDRYPEAIAVYEDFVRKNPTHSQVALATYRISKCYDFQAPDNIDRDQANSKKALDKFNYYIQNFPKTEWIDEAKQRREVLNRRIADHSEFIAQFYWKKDQYASALSRYLEILKSYSNYGDLVKLAKERASLCYLELAKILEKNPTSDAFVFFKNETPDTLKQKAVEIKN
ncbi:MAG: outer membrane protein assembly factor BamD [Bdellovibrionota bacterium]